MLPLPKIRRLAEIFAAAPVLVTNTPIISSSSTITKETRRPKIGKPIAKSRSPSRTNTISPVLLKKIPQPSSEMGLPPSQVIYGSASYTSARPAQVAEKPFENKSKNTPTTFQEKVNEYEAMYKKFKFEQNSLIEKYAELKDMHNIMKSNGDITGLTDFNFDNDLEVVNIGAWSSFDLLHVRKADMEFQDAASQSRLANALLHQIEQAQKKIFETYEETSQIVLKRWQTLIDSLCGITDVVDKEGSKSLKSKIDDLRIEKVEMTETTAAAGEHIKQNMTGVMKSCEAAWLDRDQLINQINTLKLDLAVLAKNIKAHGCNKRFFGSDAKPREMVKVIQLNEDVIKLLEEEKAVSASLKDKLNQSEARVRVARSHIGDLERMIKEHDDRRSSLEGVIRTLEQQCRQRDASNEIRSKQLKKLTKAGETTIDSLRVQRDAFENRIKELLEEMANSSLGNQSQIDEFRTETKGLQKEIVMAKKLAESEKNRCYELEKQLQSNGEIMEKMEQNCQIILEAQKKQGTNLFPNDNITVTQEDVQLYKELKLAKRKLAEAEAEILACKRDKEQFLETLGRIATSENTATMQAKTATELTQREFKITKLQEQVKELSKIISNRDEMITKCNGKIAELNLEILKVQSNSCVELDEEGFSCKEETLMQEILDLQSRVSDLTRSRTRLESAWLSSELTLERTKLGARAHQSVLAARAELRELCAHRLGGKNATQINYSELTSKLSERGLATSGALDALAHAQRRAACAERRARALERERARAQRARISAERRRSEAERALINHLSNTTNIL